MIKLQRTLRRLRTRGSIDEPMPPMIAYEHLTRESDKITLMFDCTLPGHHISCGSAEFGHKVSNFVSLHQDGDFGPGRRNSITVPTGENCTFLAIVVGEEPTLSIALQIANAIAEDPLAILMA
jgi:hypothetical protein